MLRKRSKIGCLMPMANKSHLLSLSNLPTNFHVNFSALEKGEDVILRS